MRSSRTGRGSRKTRGEVATSSIREVHRRLLFWSEGWSGKTPERLVAVSAFTIAQTLTLESLLLWRGTGCTPQYPPSKKYKSTLGDGLASAKWLLIPTHLVSFPSMARLI